MRRLHIVGRKNSGKTTLVVDLVRYWTAEGLRIGTVKHTHHRHELDTPGKDSHRHREAGAAAVGILSPQMNAVFWPAAPHEDSSNRYDQFAGLLTTCDLVLVEGHLQTTGPKVEMWRAAIGQPPYAAEHPGILAIVSDDQPNLSLPVLPRRDIPALAAALWRLVQ